MAGRFVPLKARIAIATLLGLIAIVVSILELTGRYVPLIQCDRETPQNWVHKGPTVWAIQNGLALGCGMGSRIGFWLWYAIPIGSFLVATPWAGAAIYGVYGAARGMAVWAIILLMARKRKNWDEWLFGHKKTATIITAGQLLILGSVVVIVIGF